ncbi:MAG: ribosomal protein S12 methylthiotransferase RimO [Candidatus Sericytochromatia bacterium]|nr:MAG: ribosomal protein S12 methylthiotransferase RimO [Candidatus Sericytochromatia bacterium]
MSKTLTKVGVISLGCPKNLVDTEVMLGLINNNKEYVITLDETEADVVLINTCGFIEASQSESIRTILETYHSGKKVIMAGCLRERYKGEIEKELPEVSAFIGTNEITNIVDVLDKITGNSRENKGTFDYFSGDFEIPRFNTGITTYSYVKISEGCDHPCTFCIIPKMRGKNHSRSIKSIVNEVKQLSELGVKEVVLIAQDLTAYGHDIDKKNNNIVTLLEELLKIPNCPYYRLLYTYPGTITKELLKLISNEEKILNYIDMPLQHSHHDILKAMKRPDNEKKIEELIYNMRSIIPNLALRTTFIVGFPGEEKEHFKHLYNFMERHKFEHVGVFTYSREEGTPSANMLNQVSQRKKISRRRELMLLQQEIVKENSKKLLNKELIMFVEGVNEEKGIVTGRTYYDAPEIDGFTTAKGYAQPGDIVKVRINKVKLHDSFGIIV